MLLENEPLGTFSPFENMLDFAVAYGTIDAIDYNLDGFQDILIAGGFSDELCRKSSFVMCKNISK